MDAVRRLEAVACDGYRSACSRARIRDRLRFDYFFSFLFATLPSGLIDVSIIRKKYEKLYAVMTQEDQLLT